MCLSTINMLVQDNYSIQIVQTGLIYLHIQTVPSVYLQKAICRKGKKWVHDKVMYRAVSWVYKVRVVLKKLIHALDDISFSQHNLVPHRHKFILHLCFKTMHELNTLTEQTLEEFLLDISSVSKYLSMEHLCKYSPYSTILVIYVCPCKTECQHFSGIIAK